MTKLTTHVLDTAHGTPARGMEVRLFDADGKKIVDTVTNADGRVDQPLLSEDTMKAGQYRLEFDVGPYFKRHGVQLPDPCFLDTVVIQFGIANPETHYHVPLLVSPYSYSTYRGS